MRRLMLSGALALALATPLAAPALVPETIVDRHNEEVGSVAFQSAGSYAVENLNYSVQSDVRRINSRRYDFRAAGGRVYGYVTRATATRWNVYEADHSERVGYVQRTRNPSVWSAYGNRGEDAVGEAKGPHPIVGAASVLLVFHD
jgi:hypothetical protein